MLTKYYILMKKITLLFTFLIAFGYSTYAQVSAYAFSQSSGTYTPITGGTVLGSTTSDDQRFVDPATLAGGTTTTGVGFPIGFNFTYNGVVFDRVGINNNGWISLGQSTLTPSINMASTSSYFPLSSTSTITPTLLRSRISGIGDDLQAQTGAELRIETIGSSPNRVFVVQWTNYIEYGSTGQSMSFQIRLNETTNIVEVIYGNMVFTANIETAQIGLGGSVSTDFNNRTSTTDWNATTAGTTNTSSVTFSTSVTPPTSGTAFIWTPPTPCSGTPVAGTVAPATQTLLVGQTPAPLVASGYSSGVTGLTFQWEESDDDGAADAWANAVGGTGATTASYTPPAFTTTKYYRLVVTCTNGGAFANTASVVLSACGAFTVPTLENFTTYVPECWQEADNGDLTAGPATFGTSGWIADGFGNVGTTGAFRYEIWTTGANDWLLTPLYTIPATGYEIKFDAAATQWNTTNAPTAAWEADDFVEVLVSTGTTNWTVLYTFNDTNVPSNTGTPTIIDLDAYAGMDVRFAFRVVEGATNGSADIDFSVDNFEIRMTPACIAPTTLSASNIGATSADLSWVDGSAGLQFDYEYVVQAAGTGMPAAAPGTGTTFDISSLPAPSGVLTASTAYEFWVRADCGGSGYSTWTGPYNFTTACAVYTAPFNEPFATNTFPNCWSQGGATTWEYGSLTGTTPAGFADYGANTVADHTAAAGTFIGMDGSDNTDGEVSTLLSPFIDVAPLTTPRLRYAVFSNNVNDAARNTLDVEVYDGAAWNTVNSVIDNLGTNWVEFTTDLTTLTITGPIQIRFTVTGVSNGGFTFYNDILIDDVIVEETPACANPTNLTVTNLTDAAADISWTATTGSYEYVLDMVATDPAGSGTPYASETYNATGLTQSTTYYFHVRTVCAGSTYSTWSTVSFTTLATPPANDECSNAIQVNCGDVVTGDTSIGATDSGSNASADVWYFYNGAAGDITVSLCTNTTFDSYLRIFDSCGGTQLMFNDDGCGTQSTVTFTADGTSTYYIMVEGFGTAEGAFELTTACVLSNDSFDSSAFLAYPNPVKDVLNLEYNSEISSVRVMNLLGQEVISRNIDANSTQVDMSQLSAGAYIVNVTVGNAVKTIKVVKQ